MTSKFNSSIVRQANKLVEARFKTPMTEQEQKLIAYIISESKKSDRDLAEKNQNKKIALSAKEFAYILKTQPSNIYRDAAGLSKKIQDKRLIFSYTGKDGKPAFEELTIIPYMSYDSGILTINVNSEVLKFLLDVKENFTSFKLENVLRLGSGYAIKIYQLLKQYEVIGKREFTIAELKSILAIENIPSYTRYNQFKRDILEKSKEHINQHTDILIEYEEKKLGRSFNSILFHMKTKQTQYEQALIGFEDFIKRLNDNSTMKKIWEAGQKDKKDLIKRFANAFNSWIEVNCLEYHPDEVKPLQYESPTSLLYDEKQNNEIVKDWHDEYLKLK
jgi:plasmid replication initiation protein